MDSSMPGSSVLHCLLEFAQVHVPIQPSHPLLPPFPFVFSLSQHQGLFQWVSCMHQVAKVLELQIYCQSFQWIFRVDLLLAVQGTLKSLLQHHSLKASISWCSAFPMVRLSHLYMTTGKTIALTMWTLVGKVMSLLFNTLSRFLIAFLLGSKCLLMSRLLSLSAVILEPRKVKIYACFYFFPLLTAKKCWGQMPWSYFFEWWLSSQLFHCPFSPLSRGSIVPLKFLSPEWFHLHIWGCQ